MKLISKFKKYLPIILILLVAFILRFWRLGDYPALNADEAAIGYNAYSLIETGKDEHGNSWPIHFQSFNDYKPGLYVYLVLPFIKFFGLNEWSVRIPGAFFGVLTVWLVYLLIKELFANQKDQLINSNYHLLATVSAFMLAISPWHIHFSRGGWEVGVATFFMVLGLYLFLKGIKNNLPLLMLSAVSFALSLYTYHAARVVVPLLGLGLTFNYRNLIGKNFKSIALAALVGLVAILPLIKDLTKSDVASRAAGVGLFADTGPLSRINEQRGEHVDLTSPLAIILHNKVANYGLAFLENLSEHFQGEFLFLSGEAIQRNKVPEVGQMYVFAFPLLLIGFWLIFKNPKGWGIILWWIVIAPTAAALTFQSPHALRSQNMVIPLEIVSAFGLTFLLGKISQLRTKKLKYLLFTIFSILILWNFSKYIDSYWRHMSRALVYSSQYGVKELAKYIENNNEGYENILITDRYDQPYILMLFYLKYSPSDFQNDHVLTPRDNFGFSTVRTFGKFKFKEINWDIDQPLFPNSLIAGTDEEIPDEANIIEEIYGTNGYKYFEVVEN